MTAHPTRQKLLSSAAILGAVAIASLAAPARAIPPIDPTRVIQATDTADAGHTYTPGAALDIIDINAPTAIINWAPLDPNNPIGLVKANGEARFQSANDFAVLNRITPTNGNTATFEGAVTSFVNGTPGGTVMFYSADGFVIAPTGTFNVGSLVLTTGDITGAFTSSSFKTAAPANVSAPITNNGSITASNYIVLASPNITQNGTVRTGSAAYVAAGATSFTFSNGLFDILVDNAVDNAKITHTAAATTEINDRGASVLSPSGQIGKAYFVAVPKNNAMSLLLTGNVGYPAAVVANSQGGSVVLSAGTSVKSIGQSFATYDAVADAAQGSIQLTNGTYNADLFANATGDVTVQATGGGTASFGSRLDIASETGTAELIANNGNIAVTNQLTVASRGGAAGLARVDLSNGGTLGALTLNISAVDDRATGASNGGTASLTINNGGLSIINEVVIDASAISRGNDAGNATAGTASLNLTNADFEAASLTMRADASAAAAPNAGGAAGIGQGGTILFETHPTTNFTVSPLSGFVLLSASGQGGAGTPNDLSATPQEGDASGVGGAGNGGTITVTLDSGAGSSFSTPSITAAASGSGGQGHGACNFCTHFGGQDAGDAQGGTIEFTVASGSVGSATTTLSLDSGSLGGNGGVAFDAFTVDGGDAGDAAAGESTLTITGGTLTLASLGLSSKATGGIAGDSLDHDDIYTPGNPKIPGGTGGAGGLITPGAATLSVTGGQLVTSGQIVVDASADAGRAGYGDTLGGAGTIGQGGTAIITASGNGSIQAAGLFANAEGKGAQGAPGGEGRGGTATISADGGTISAGSIIASAAGVGGNAARINDQNGTGRGGSATVSVINGGTMTAASLSSGTDGYGNGEPGDSDKSGTFLGGSGSGGDAHIVIDGAGSTLNITSGLRVSSTGFGAFGESAGGSGDNSAAIAELAVTGGGTLNYTGTEDIILDASAGGGGTVAVDDPVQLDDSIGGIAKGGTAQLVISGATLNVPAGIDVIMDASAFGGDALGKGGDATGGTAVIRVGPGGNFQANGAVSLDASAFAGAGGVNGNGGAGTGGTALLDAVAGTTTIAGKLSLLSLGEGGAGNISGNGNGGIGTGGFARLALGDGNPNVTLADLEIDSSGTGGDADAGGKEGGAAKGGEARIASISGIATINGTSSLKANATGGIGGTGKGGDAEGGTASVAVVGGNTVHAVGNMTLEASATGGAGVGGGKGTGGTATINAFGGTGNFDGKVTLRSIGQGGAGLGGGDGGAGIGNVTIVDLGTAFPATFTIGSLETDSSGKGGNANGGGRHGGAATGGTSSIGDGGTTNGSLTIAGTTDLNAGANGGSGGSGNGGDALGGTAVIGVGALNTFSFNDDVTLNAAALGGDGGALRAGNGTGGTAKLEAFAGTVPILGTLSLFANGSGGFGLGGGDGGAGIGGLTRIALGDATPSVTLGGLLTDSGAVGGDADGGGKNGGAATGGTTSVGRAISVSPAVGPSGSVTVNGTTRMVALARGGLAGTGVAGSGAGGTVDIAAVGPVTLNFNGTTTLEAQGTRAKAGSVNLTSNSTNPAPPLRFATLNVDATGAAGTAPSFAANMVDDRIVVTNNATINVGGDANFVSTDNGGFDVGGTFNLTAGGAMNVTHFGSDTLSVITANNAKFTVGDFFASDSSPILITNQLEIGSGFKIRAKKLKAGTVILKANDDVTVTQVDSPVSAEGKNVTIANDGDVTVTSVTAQRAILVSSLNGSATVGDLSAGTDPAFGGNVTVQGKTFVTFNGTAGTPQGSVTGFASTINVNGKLEAPFVYLTSSKLTLGATAMLGKAGLTNFLSISNNGTERSTIGGAGGGPGYVLSAADLNKMRASQILISLPAAGVPGQPDVTVESFTLDAPTIFGNGDGGLIIDPPASIAVVGAVKITNANPGTFLTFEATDSINIVTDTGSIKLFDPSNAPGGRLNLIADNIIVASQSAINDLAALTTTQQREARLSITDNPSDEGAIVAGGMEALVNNAFYIQNSGTGSKTILSNRRGFTVGSAGLKITNGAAPLEVIINGRMVKTATTFYLGDKLIPLIDFNTPVEGVLNYAPLSSVNGCVIINAPCVATSGIPLPPIQDVVNLVAHNDPPTGDQTGQGPVQAVNLPLIQFAGSTPYSFAPPIDEPVTGAGNQDLWGGAPQMPIGGATQQPPLIGDPGCGGPGQTPCQ